MDRERNGLRIRLHGTGRKGLKEAASVEEKETLADRYRVLLKFLDWLPHWRRGGEKRTRHDIPRRITKVICDSRKILGTIAEGYEVK